MSDCDLEIAQKKKKIEPQIKDYGYTWIAIMYSEPKYHFSSKKKETKLLPKIVSTGKGTQDCCFIVIAYGIFCFSTLDNMYNKYFTKNFFLNSRASRASLRVTA